MVFQSCKEQVIRSNFLINSPIVYIYETISCLAILYFRTVKKKMNFVVGYTPTCAVYTINL